MFPPKKILFPVDFSERCASVAPMVEAFTQRFESELTLVHVVPSRTPDGLADSAQAQLGGFAARALAGLNAERVVLYGDPAREIVGFAHERKSDLILMPTHGYGPFRRFLFGSVTLKVLHDAWCPVWTDVHAETPANHRDAKFRSIVCALDLTGKSHPTLRWAAQFAAKTDARLLLVHAIPDLNSISIEYIFNDWQRQASDEARQQIACLQRNAGTHAPVDIVTGDVAYAVRTAAEEANADLLVIGRSVENGLIGRLRTHAYPIIRHSPCPVVSV